VLRQVGDPERNCQRLCLQIGSHGPRRIGGLDYLMREGEALAGVAWRANDDWRVQVLARTADGAANAGGYKMAGVEVPAAVMRTIESQISGEPLDAEAEAAAQKRGWK